MPTISLQSSFSIDYFSFLTLKEYKNRYLAGIPIPSSISNETIQFFMDVSISEIQSILSILIKEQVYSETRDFHKQNWVNWSFLQVSYPCVYPIGLDGFLGTTKQITYPQEWLSVKKSDDGKFFSRTLSMVPTKNSAHSEAIIYSGVIPQAHYFGSKKIPDYWTVKYVTGWKNPPLEIVDLVGKLTSFKILQIISDALMSGELTQTVDGNGNTVLTSNGTNFGGLGFGISSKSISIDGLSQSYSSYVNGQTGIYGARLKQLGDELDMSKPNSMIRRVYDQYGAIVMGVC